MEHKKFWIFVSVIFLVVAVLLLIFILSGDEDTFVETPITENITFVVEQRDEFEESYNRALGIGIEIRELSFVSSFNGADDFVLDEKDTFSGNDEIIIHYLADKVKALQTSEGILLNIVNEVHLYDPKGEELTWVGDLYSFNINRNVDELGDYELPFFIFANAVEFNVSGTYTMTVEVRNPEFKHSAEDKITFRILE